MLLVIVTTVFSWFNVNSWSIMLLVLCRLLSGDPRISVKTAFRNGLFLAFLLFVLIESAGFLHTHHFREQANLVSKDATLVAIAYVCCSGGFADPGSWKRLMTGYYIIIVAAVLYCLAVAFRNYLATGDTSVFFYHSLTRPISQNAILFSVYVCFALLFALSPDAGPAPGLRAPRQLIRGLLAGFYLGALVLLDSKLLLVISLLIVLQALFRKFSFRANRLPLLVAGLALLAGVFLLALTDNPVSRRYRELAAGDLGVVRQERFNPGMYFNAVQLRLLEWRFAGEILAARNAWVFGVSPGDSQALLDNKYEATRMYIGNPADGPDRKDRGFIGYNFHDQFLETTVRDGIVGLLSLLFIFGLLIRQAARNGTAESVFVVATLLLLFIPESPLTMQHGIFLFCFFPLLLPYARKIPARG